MIMDTALMMVIMPLVSGDPEPELGSASDRGHSALPRLGLGFRSIAVVNDRARTRSDEDALPCLGKDVERDRHHPIHPRLDCLARWAGTLNTSPMAEQAETIDG